MLTSAIIDSALTAALAEDAPWGDLTAQTFVPEHASARAELVARESGVLSGGRVFARTFELTDARITVTLLAADGDHFSAGDRLAVVEGPARSVLTAERIALNFTQRMSGIATLTSAFVTAAAEGRQRAADPTRPVRIADTRKTTPGLRAFEKHAVVSGGGHNHRFGLSDAVMIKDNHLAVLAEAGADVTTTLLDARKRLGHTTTIEVEVDRIDQIAPVLAGGADIIMLDNFTLEELRAGVALIDGQAIVEASGTVTLETVGAIAATGVDVISSGALTHSVRSIDLGLDLVLDAGHNPGRDAGADGTDDDVRADGLVLDGAGR